MPALQQAQELKDFAEEMFELSKEIWAAQTRAKGRSHAEISETEFVTLDILAKAEKTLTVGDIQRKIGVLPAQMSRIIRSLENKAEKPLIACKINASDKRKVDVELTPAGRQAYQSYRQTKLGATEKLLAALSEEDRTELMRLLRLIRDFMHKSLT
ncbi:MAG TPA: MarR family transcriptional regulator [Phycisphaerae bacterium]|jgi:DNA-binding MarR family transcriptional regulator|nr:MarR family transcriptional regulator [Phycisphaerae bacterium]HOL26075.1 MarR family transcriptional regulator [Phycisphaerae bacterium]HPP21529.1 MarR family transcriptional regulator [Phycisphaerae bacterium]HPU31495.1 MarR family transcriptional regulator [Phycisphaerae bacterium]HQA43351.1 MarR family transcriptional regulator [Phycisphaerae bacterium]